MQLLASVGYGRMKKSICSIRNSRKIGSREKPPRPGRGEEARGEASRTQGRSGPRKKRWKCFLCSLHAAEEAAWPKCLLLGSAPGRLSRKLGARRAQQVLGWESLLDGSTSLAWDPRAELKWAQTSTLRALPNLLGPRIFVHSYCCLES